MTTTTHDAVQFAADGQADKFRESVASLLMDKIKDRLSTEKITVAQKFFNQDSVNNTDTGESE